MFITSGGGFGQHIWIIDSDWWFDAFQQESKRTTVTPAVYKSDYTNDTFSDNEFDDSSSSADTDDNLCDCSDDESLGCSVHSGTVRPPTTGNGLVNLPCHQHPQGTINKI